MMTLMTLIELTTLEFAESGIATIGTGKGYVSQEELAERCGVGAQTIQRWRRHGWINAKRYNDQPEYLYEPTLNALPAHIAHQYSSIPLSAN